MTTKPILFASILMLLLTAAVQADNATISELARTDAETTPQLPQNSTTAQNLQQPRQKMEELQFNMQELQTVLAEQPVNMTLVKTKTSWIRKLLAELHDWSLNQPTTDDTERLFNQFCYLIGDMEQEVARDDMLDKIELQTLISRYTQAEHALTEIERSTK